MVKGNRWIQVQAHLIVSSSSLFDLEVIYIYIGEHT